MINLVELTGRVEITSHPVVVERSGELAVTYSVDAVYDEGVLAIRMICVNGYWCEDPPRIPLCHLRADVVVEIETSLWTQVLLAWQGRATCIRCRQETGVSERHEIYCGQTEIPEMPS